MTNTIGLQQLPWYHGQRELNISLPESWQVEVCNMAGYDRPAMSPAEIKAAIAQPSGTPPIRELARGKKEVAIVFDDMSRVTRVAQIIPFVLEELAKAGIPDSAIRFISALGLHGAMDRLDFAEKLGEDVVSRFPIYNHNAFGNCVNIGTTNYGTAINVNAEVMKCDLKIGIGSIVPHATVGFGGGGKIVLPGIASVDTIEAFHKLMMRLDPEVKDTMSVGMGIECNNPFVADIADAARLTGLDIKIDCTVNARGEAVAIFAGPLEIIYPAGCEYARAHYRTHKAVDKDIVITNTFAKVNEWELAMLTAYPSVKRTGGDVVIICNSPKGHVTHYGMSPFGNEHNGGILGLQMRVPDYVNHLILYSDYPDIGSLGIFKGAKEILYRNSWDDVLQLLTQIHGDSATVAVYPNADIQYFG